jgi:hypothetical protein
MGTAGRGFHTIIKEASKMKALKYLFLSFVILSFVAMGAASANPNIVSDGAGGFVVYPTATYPTDAESIQVALNSVDPSQAPDGMPTVLLMANNIDEEPSHFDFGTASMPFEFDVIILQNCILKGELDSDGITPLTEIINGNTLFGIFAQNVIIKDLKSSDAKLLWCHSFPSGFGSDVEINNVHLHNVKVDPYVPLLFPIVLANDGKAIVRNCTIEIAELPFILSTGIFVTSVVPELMPQAEITGNRITMDITSGAGVIEVGQGILLSDADQCSVNPPSIVSNNIIENASVGIRIALDNSTVTGNDFINITEVGILVVKDSNVIERNEFRQSNLTGLKGNGKPCVILGMLVVGDTGELINMAEDNYVKEQGDFPTGSGGALFQVLDGSRLVCEAADAPPYCTDSIPNRVIGHPADTAEQQKGVYPNILEKITIAHDQEIPDPIIPIYF